MNKRPKLNCVMRVVLLILTLFVLSFGFHAILSVWLQLRIDTTASTDRVVFIKENVDEVNKLLWILSFLGSSLVTSIICVITLKAREYDTFKLVYRDTLTSAYNTRMLYRTMNTYKKSGTPFALIYMDIDKFKEINDTKGHQAGDILLISFVERLKNQVKSDDKIFRMGGDEFVLLVDQCSDDITVNRIMKRIDLVLENEFSLVNTKIKISVSKGYAMYPKDSDSMMSLIDIADKLMYKAKSLSHKDIENE